MIYAYCLSVFSIHFFTKHNLSKFKLRLINQQTGDCTDSMILDAQKLTADSFPVAIKLKGGQRLLMKIKFLSLPSKSGEVLVGEGVVNFDKASIDSTLRVPIYDKQKGVEEIAICSIDFFLSGFQVEKHVSINVDKSRSRFEDWRERTEDAIYSQMSYTVESQEERKVQVNSKLADTIKKQESMKNKVNQLKGKQRQKQQPKKFPIMQPLSKEKDRQQDGQEKPFALQNSAYLGQKSPKKKFAKKQISNPSARSNKNNRFAFDSMSNELFKDKQQSQLSANKQKKNDLLIYKLKKYLQDIEDNNQLDSSPKHGKKRRKNIKVQEYAAYNFQNIFIKYHRDLKSKPTKILRNIKAIRIIQNQIKQNEQGKIIPQIINKLFITSVNKQKIMSFDALGFRSHCIINNQSQSALSIPIPCEENVLKVIVMLNQEGNFQGNFGLQEGEKMNIKLNRMNYEGNQSILQRSQFKLIFDLRAEYIERKSAKLININSDGSFREPYDILVPEQDIKKRVELLSCQPWGFLQSYAKQVNLSEQSKQIINKINKQLPQNQLSKLWSMKSKQFHQQNKKIKQKKPVSESEGQKINQKPATFAEQQKVKSMSSKTKEYLENTPIKIKKLKPITTPSSENHEVYQINNIRNGNRNNYKFKDRTPSKQIKQAWQEILFKRKLQQEKLQQKKQKLSRMNIGNYTSKNKKKLLDSLNTQIISNSDSQSLSSNPFPPHRPNKLYKYSQNDDKESKFPLRSLKLKISNISITQPQAAIDEKQSNQTGKFVKFSILNNVIYFTQVIFNGGYNSILWKLQGCIFEQLTGSEKLEVQIYQTVKNRIKMVGKSQIRISRLFFLRNNHIYNGRIVYNNISNGQFTISFEIDQYFPFQAIQEEEEDTVNLKKNHSQNKNGYRDRKNVNNSTHHSQKYINTTLKRRGLQSTLKKDKNEKRNEEKGKRLQQRQEQLQQSMSMPIGLNKSQQ